jgi:putative PEP-CTERM system histidine kinase
MSLTDPATIGYLLSFAVFSILTFRLSRQSGPRTVFRALWIAGVATVLWSAAGILLTLGQLPKGMLIIAIEVVRNLAWLIVLLLWLAEIRDDQGRAAVTGSAVAQITLVAVIVVAVASAWAITSEPISVLPLTRSLFALLILGLCELVVRNAPGQLMPISGYLCIAAGGIFLFDLLTSLPFAFIAGHVHIIDDATGYVASIASLPLVAALKKPLTPIQSEPENRRFIFRLFLLVSLTVTILSLLVAEYYIRAFGGSWPGVIRVVVIAVIVSLAAVTIVSPSLRGQARVFLTKSFLRYKYDYRKEWLRFIGTLSETGLDHLTNTSVRAIARIVNSPGGVVWVVDPDSQRYKPIGSWQCALPLDRMFTADCDLVKFMVERQWVIDLSEMQHYPSMYSDLEPDQWFVQDDRWWIIVPLLLADELYGFVALQHGSTPSSLNFEDHDLLRTVGRHVATHLKQAESEKKLSEAQQFSTYHRLSAFLMHDLNNLAAQLSLVVKNAEKHKSDPDFVEDMVATVANSATRMNRLLEQLSNVTEQSRSEDVDPIALLRKAIANSKAWLPRPTLQTEEQGLWISADPERLCGIFEHLIRNAQDATEESGQIDIEIEERNRWAVIRIRDTGCGMTEEFISERLFRPFDSTKGSQSMGIGAYQAREYIRSLGGQVDVASIPGDGSTFTIHIPVAR